MKNLLVKFLKYLTKGEEQEPICKTEPQQSEAEENELIVETKQKVQETPKEEDQPKAQITYTTQIEESGKKQAKKPKKKTSADLTKLSIDPRDIMESMGIPFLSLSKNRKAPIVYESPDGTTKVRISCHSEHYIASIYDWDIIQCIAGKIQEVFNSKSDVPPRTLIIPRHELLRSIYRHDGKKQEKDLKASLSRLNTTLIETTVSNEDGRYEAGFGFLDSYGYTNRKDVKEFCITLSQWLYELICHNGSLLKVHPEYFKITSGLKRFLYRTARKHVGNQNENWPFLIETLHKKSGSEQVLRYFKRDLKKAVQDNDIPGYHLKWIEKDGKTLVHFTNLKKVSKKDIATSEVEAKKISKFPSNSINNEQKRIVSKLISSSIKRIR